MFENGTFQIYWCLMDEGGDDVGGEGIAFFSKRIKI